MPLNSNILLYNDCRDVLSAMIDRGGGRARFRTRAEAINFRLRCNYFRKLFDKELRASGSTDENPFYRITIGLNEASEGAWELLFQWDKVPEFTLIFNNAGA